MGADIQIEGRQDVGMPSISRRRRGVRDDIPAVTRVRLWPLAPLCTFVALLVLGRAIAQGDGPVLVLGPELRALASDSMHHASRALVSRSA